MAKRFLWSMILLSYGSILCAQPFACDGSMYVVLLDQNQGTSGLYAIRPGESIGDALVTPVRSDLGVPVQVIGFNVTDNHIYGFAPSNSRMYRIGAGGQVTELGVPANLDTLNFTYLAGEIGPNGGPFLLIARSKTTGYDARFYSVRLNQPHLPASYVSVVSDVPTRIEDIAYDPILGELVGYDSAGGRMVSINSSGAITAGTFSTAGPVESIGSVFFDRKGQLYGYGGRTNLHNTLYQFNRITGRLVGSVGGVIGRNSDGCGCPYQIHFTKSVEPAVVLPCSEVTITYRFHNTAAIAYGQVRITDTLPEIFTITNIDRPPFFADVQSGVGTHIFDATGMQVLLSHDSVVIRARVGLAPPGRYGSRALARPFPLGLGSILYTDDPSTSTQGDTTFLEILPAASILMDTLISICQGASAALRPSVQGLSTRWSTGEASPTISVASPGLYWVEVEGACGFYRDSIRVEEINTGLWADLGPDREIIAGEQAVLSVRHNSITPLRYQWTALSNDSLSCLSCPSPVAGPLQTSAYAVTVSDTYGCSASDTLTLRVKIDVPVFVPNAFSPDGNGINDVLYVHGPEGILIDYFQIFDRWGGQVFRQTGGRVNDPDQGWDGKYKGRPAPQGAYVWVLRLRFADGAVKNMSGEVFLVKG